MKHSFILILLFTGLFFGCRKTPDLSDLSSEFLVSTSLDKTANFGSYTTFFIPDTIANLGGVGSDTILTGPDVTQLVNTVKSNLTQRGYVFTAKANHPDLGLTLSVVKVENIVVYPGWWDGIPGYWWPWYWDWFYPYYYPWSVVYTYPTGSIILNMIDLKNAATKQKLTVVWHTAGMGALGTSLSGNVQRGIDAINQGFQQSPYLHTP